MTGQDSRLNVLRHWPERIVAVTDGERRLEPGEQAEPSDVEYVRADLHRGAVERAEKAEAENRLLRETCRINGWPEFGEAESTDLLRDGGQ